MADRSELAYVYARVCGSMNRLWIGARATELLRIGRLSEIWRVLFSELAPSLPENALLKALESRVVREALDDFKSLAKVQRREEAFFMALRRKAEFARVKRVLLAIRQGEVTCPPSDDAELEEGFDSSAYPKLSEMFAKGPYSWIGPATLEDLPAAENRLDRQYYVELWSAFSTLPSAYQGGLRGLLLLEIELENVVWALRLARYYSMGREAIEPLLIALPDVDVRAAALSGALRKFDRRSDWEGWKYEALVRGGGEPWRLDVRAVETEARRLLYKKLKRALHLNPFTCTPLYSFYKMKEFEASVILAVLEGLHLGAPAEEIANFAFVGGPS